ncbi:MAG: efflux RND transporter periplasmic adaptor subunit, partial [Bacteroidales bacterium]|nr:efflux RND transporter periplasmic adaptor subunit [Bacteroidales bacterium]
FLLIGIITTTGIISSCNARKSKSETIHKPAVHDENIVSLTRQQINAINLKLGKIEKHNLSSTVKSNGRIELPPQSKANVSAMVGGVVKEIFVIEGDFIKKGQTLATLEHPDIVDIQQQYLENESNLEFLQQDFLRKKKLFKEKVSSGKEYQKASSEYNSVKSTVNGLKAKLKMLGIDIRSLKKGHISSTINIISPIDGYIRLIEVNIGSFVKPDDDMFVIVDNRNVHADLLVYEKDIHKIKSGQKVSFSFSSIPGKQPEGTIFSVGKAFEDEARAITVHATIENPESNIIPGMYVNAYIMVDTFTTDVLPEEAIATEGDKHFIFIKTEGQDGSEKNTNKTFFKKIEIIPGIRENGFVEIKLSEPLSEDTELAINTAYYLLAEMGKGDTEHEH